MIIKFAVGLKVISDLRSAEHDDGHAENAKAPKRWVSLAPSMTKPATSIEYTTIPVATVVGGTPKLSTMPPSATGREATLKDMIAWPSAMAIIGTHDCACLTRRDGPNSRVMMCLLPI